jgi:hypothetical protein
LKREAPPSLKRESRWWRWLCAPELVLVLVLVACGFFWRWWRNEVE